MSTSVQSNSRVRAVGTGEVCNKLSVSRSTLWRLIKSGQFPAGTQIYGTPGRAKTYWLESEVDSWLLARLSRPLPLHAHEVVSHV